MSTIKKQGKLGVSQIKKSGPVINSVRMKSDVVTRSTSDSDKGQRKIIKMLDYDASDAESHVLGRKQSDTLKTEPLIGGSLPPPLGGDKASLSLSLNVLIEYLEIYGFNPKGFRPESTLNHWNSCSQEIGWMKFLKYKFAAFFSFVIKDELPPKPFTQEDNPSHLVGGSAGRFIRLQLRKKDRLEFATGILYLKKGMPRPNKLAVEKQTLKTYELLTTTHEPEMCVVNSKKFTINHIIHEVQRTASELFYQYPIHESDLHIPYAPSVKANYVDSRRDLGTFGTLIDYGHQNGNPILRDFLSPVDLQTGEFKVFNNVKEEQRECSNIPELELNPKLKILAEEVYKDIYETVRSKAFNEPCKVQLVGLSEALKVRVISKGPPLTYFALKPVQKFLHTILRRHPIFKFIGVPANESDLIETFFQKPGKFLSVDYSSATDMLNPKLSRACANQICKDIELPEDLRQLFLKALTGHTIIKPGSSKSVVPDESPQLWGQLMGSIVSFPILCVVNAAVCRMSMEVGLGKPCSLDQIPLLINGDDALLRCDNSVMHAWKNLSHLAGLEPSVGKVYFSDSYMNINSTSYSFTEDEESQSITEHKYVNMGLVKGLSRSEGLIGKKSAVETVDSLFDSTIGSRHRDLMKSCPSKIRLTAHIQFIRNHWTILRNLRVPWYIPESLGGLGLSSLIEVEGSKDVEIFSSSKISDSRSWKYLEYDMHSRRDNKIHHLRVGPSDLDLKCVRLLMNNVLSFKPGKVPGESPIRSRESWFENKGFRANVKFATFINKAAWSELSAIKKSQKDVFTFLDTAAYYLIPSTVAQQPVESQALQLKMIKTNERAWDKLSKIAKFEYSGFKGFTFIAESMSAHPFFTSVSGRRLKSLKRFVDMSHDRFDEQTEQLFDMTQSLDPLEEGKHKDLIEKLILD